MTDTVKNWTQWLKSSRFSYMTEEQKEQTLRWLFVVRDKILKRANLKANDTLLDIGTGTGLLAFGAYELLQDKGKVIASDKFEDCVIECAEVAKQCGIESGFETLQSSADDIKLPDNSIDVVVMRSVLVHIIQKQPAINEFYRILKEGGRISIFEPIINSNTRYYELITPDSITDYEDFKLAECELMARATDPLTNFTGDSLVNNFEIAGFKDIDLDLETTSSTYPVNEAMILPWFTTPPSPGTQSMKEKFMQYFPESKVNRFIEEVKKDLNGKTITVKSNTAFIKAIK